MSVEQTGGSDVTQHSPDRERLKKLQFRDMLDGVYVLNEQGEPERMITSENDPAEFEEYLERLNVALGHGTKEEREKAAAEADRLSDDEIKDRVANLTKQLDDKIIDSTAEREALAVEIANLTTQEQVYEIGTKLQKYKDTAESIERARQSKRIDTPKRSRGLENAQKRVQDHLNERFNSLRGAKTPMSSEDRDAFEEAIKNVENTTGLNAIYNEIRRYPEMTLESKLRKLDQGDGNKEKVTGGSGQDNGEKILTDTELVALRDSDPDAYKKYVEAVRKTAREKGLINGEKKDAPKNSGEWSDDQIGNKARELREFRKAFDIPKGEPRDKFNQLARELKSETDFNAAMEYVKSFPKQGEKGDAKDKGKPKGSDAGKQNELLDRAPSERARKKLAAILRMWEEKERDPSKAGAYSGRLQSEMAGMTSWQDKERAYVRANIPSSDPTVDEKGPDGIKVKLRAGQRLVETMPDGRIKITEIGADGKEVERFEGPAKSVVDKIMDENFGPVVFPDLLPEADAGENTDDAHARYRAEVAQWEEWKNRGPVKRFFDALRGRQRPEPPLAPEVHALLSDPSRTAEERKLIHMVAQATQKHNGIRMQDAVDRGETGRFARIRESLKGGGKAVAIATAITVVVAMSGGTFAAMPILAKVIGAGVGALASTAAKNRVEKIGRTDKISRYVVPWMIGSIAGIASGAVAGHAIEAVGNWLNSTPGALTPPQANIAPTSAETIPPTQPSAPAPSWIPAAPPGFDQGDYGFLGNTITFDKGSTVWAQITDGLCRQGLLDVRGQGAFADAFYRTIDAGNFKDLFLSYNDRPLGAGISWNNIPIGTVGNYEQLFENREFVEKLCKRIAENYPALTDNIEAGGFSIKNFVRGVAYSHGVKI